MSYLLMQLCKRLMASAMYCFALASIATIGIEWLIVGFKWSSPEYLLLFLCVLGTLVGLVLCFYIIDLLRTYSYCAKLSRKLDIPLEDVIEGIARYKMERHRDWTSETFLRVLQMYRGPILHRYIPRSDENDEDEEV